MRKGGGGTKNVEYEKGEERDRDRDRVGKSDTDFGHTDN